MRKNNYLSDLTKVQLRELFIERLIDNCNYIVRKYNNPNDINFGDESFFNISGSQSDP